MFIIITLLEDLWAYSILFIDKINKLHKISIEKNKKRLYYITGIEL